jgi:hypothetical protein
MEGCGSSSNLRFYPSTRLEGLRKITKHFNHDSWFSGRDLNQGPPRYEENM